ncbi:hypothetical protein CDAR_586851 [Caerostris darwini]|uniref:Uncharacterized protein n=1 Tax=Caerostris darwini TaxID=1538125 RepID=A0AAV4SWD5_9ARAC|nr:hypothetical protein CDAR_586851 [Caerostris darwini]
MLCSLNRLPRNFLRKSPIQSDERKISKNQFQYVSAQNSKLVINFTFFKHNGHIKLSVLEKVLKFPISIDEFERQVITEKRKVNFTAGVPLLAATPIDFGRGKTKFALLI